MSARLELPQNLLDARRPLGPRVDGELRSTILQLSQLTDRGECLEAAQQAAELLRAEVYDLRLACVYLVGLFVERGPAHLPELLRCTRRLVADELAAPPPLRGTPRVLDTTVQWLLQSWLTHIQFHTQRRDDTWTGWLRAGSPGLAGGIAEELEALARVMGEVIEQPVSAGALGRIARWARGELARALTRLAEKAEKEAAAARAAAEAEASAGTEPPHDDDDLGDPGDDDPGDDDDDTDEIDDGPYDDEPHDDDDTDDEPYDDDLYAEPFHDAEPLRRARAPARPAPRDEAESPALASLRRKLEGFSHLVDRGEFAKAAIIARDVQQVIERFDPVEFLPSLFAGYFRVLSQRLDDLRPHLEQADDTPWQVLTRFYQADLDGFLED